VSGNFSGSAGGAGSDGRPGRVVRDHEIGRAAVGLRHLPVDRNLGVGIGRQLLDGGHRIAVEAIDQGFNHGQCIRR
jgi:hypothetical protein